MSRRRALLLPVLLLVALFTQTGPAAGSAHLTTGRSAAAVSPGHAGGRICGKHYCIYAYVDGLVHGDALSASGTVKVVDDGVPIARLQVDRVTVGTSYSTKVNSGPKNLGSSAPVTQTVSATVDGHACGAYLTTVFASGRLSDGTLISGSVTGVAYYSDYGICPGPTLATKTQDLAPTLAAGGARTVHVVTKLLNSNDGSRGFASVQLTLTGVAGPNRVLRASIDDAELSDTSGLEVHPFTANRTRTNLAPGATVTLLTRTYAARWPKGCQSFYYGTTVSTRFSNGDLFRTVVSDNPHRLCH